MFIYSSSFYDIPPGTEKIKVEDIDNLSPSIFPESVREIEFSDEFVSLLPGKFPGSVSKIKFGSGFESGIGAGVLPDGLKELIFSYSYKPVLMSGVIPQTVEVMEVGHGSLGNGVLPANLKKLRFSNFFEARLEVGVFPDGLEELYMSHKYSHPFEKGLFPDGLRKLYLPNSHPHVITPGIIPQGVTELSIGKSPILENSLPEGLKIIKFESGFDHPIPPGFLPRGLEYISLGSKFNHKLVEGSIPPNVNHIIFSMQYDHDLPIGVIPKSVRYLEFQNYGRELSPGVIPEGVEEIVLGSMYNFPLKSGTFPTTLRKLRFSIKFNQPIEKGHIPYGVETIEFGYRFNSKIAPDALPFSLKILKFSFDFDQFLLPRMIPHGVEELVFGSKFNQPIFSNSLPSTLRKLTLGYGFSQKLSPGSIPQTVEEVRFGSGYQGEIGYGVLPPRLKVLQMSGAYKGKYFNPDIIPSTLEKLYIGETLLDVDMFMEWMRFVKLMKRAGVDVVNMELETLYRKGFPIPVEPHESTILPIDNYDLVAVRAFSVERNFHGDVFQNLNGELYDLVNNWIYKDYASFNRFISHMNMGRPMEYTDREFVEGYILDTDENAVDAAIEAYQDFRYLTMSVPRLDHKVYAWRGLHGLDDLCQVSAIGTHIAFTRFMACSVAQEVSCSFAKDGVLMLIEIPPRSPILNLSSLKNSEPEFVLPDRSVFKVVNRIPASTCSAVSCKEIIHIELVGIYTEDQYGILSFEEYYSKEPMDVVDIQHFY